MYLSFAWPFWHLFTRLGEAQILLPALALVLGWYAWRLRARRVVAVWLACVGAAAVLTAATKVAFIGWGLGIPSIDFTGFSGHAMFSAAVLPVLGAALGAALPAPVRTPLVVAGYLLAAGVAVSRVLVQAHSPSEAVAGFVLGCIASGCALAWARAPATHAPVALAAALAAWLVVMPAEGPPSHTHGWVVRLSLAISGHEHPYTREAMLRRYQLQQLQRNAGPVAITRG